MRVVAFGGGHGLAAALRALRLLRAELALDITAVVTVSDDGGSTGRLRTDRGGLAVGDLRQALAALADPADPVSQRFADLLQHRFAGADPLSGHTVGNIVIAGLMEVAGDPVRALDEARDMVRAVGRILPMSCNPVNLEATIRGHDPTRPGAVQVVHGQHHVAITPGVVEDVRLSPARPLVAPAVTEAIGQADWLLFGPGSWYTSVIPHLLVPDLAEAIRASDARRLVTLNLAAERETAGLSLPDHLRALARYLPGLRVDVVLADGKAVGDPIGLQSAAESLRARVVFAPVAVPDGAPRHDPTALAHALHEVLTAAHPPPAEPRHVGTGDLVTGERHRMTDRTGPDSNAR